MTSRAPADATGTLVSEVAGGIGESAARSDGPAKVRGDFAFASDLWVENMVWGATLRSPHPYARIRSIDIGPALRMRGVHAVLTAEDVPGMNRYGLKHADQPALAEDVVRFRGEPVALVAAEDPDTARRATESVVVDYEVLAPVTDPQQAAHDTELPALHPDDSDGNVVRYQPIRCGDPSAHADRADVVVSDVYTVGMQDQAFLGPEAGLALPTEEVVWTCSWPRRTCTPTGRRLRGAWGSMRSGCA